MNEGWNVNLIPGHKVHHYFKHGSAICRNVNSMPGRGQGFISEGPFQAEPHEFSKDCKRCVSILAGTGAAVQ